MQRRELTSLEPCCGPRREWSDVREATCVMGDKLLEVQPQVVLDFQQLPFKDGVFDSIFFDPPHLIRNDVKHFNKAYRHFGNWKSRREWEAALDSVNTEFWRVTRPGALLRVKIIHGDDRRVTKIDDLRRLSLWNEIDIDVRPSAVGWSTCHTIRVVFARID